ncbi:hypothetical protein [Saliphagus infecundisoli]|uniref:Rho termination factor N-terminal domain-containing protein n=1 Tax=Saliphagus infecundisoli TaxID=1849069 RepID=A0ABD5QFK7_9EURY|nr:hypothetical protein [Saliphagus infecundisoli]
MSDDEGDGGFDLAEIVTDEVTEQLDASELLGGGSIKDQVDAGALGASVGREFGARAGREFGEAIGGEVHETIDSGLERGAEFGEIAGEVKTAIREAIVGVVSRLASREAIASAAEAIGSEELGDGVRAAIPEESAGDAVDGAIEEATDEVEEATPDIANEESDGDEEAREDEEGEETEEAEDGDEEGDDESGGLTEKADEATPDLLAEGDGTPAPEDLEGLRRETLEDFLEVMSYRDLQSVAKDIDVKANLSREEMTEEIIETVSESEE